MTDESREARAYRIFSAVLELPADQREREVEARCNGDQALRAEVLGLLATALADADATAAFRILPAADEPDLAGLAVGRFALRERVGAGGMGVVYLAERTDGVLQTVAIKLLSTALGARARPRFEREAQLLARLEHPAIARLIDAGIRDERAWIAMEFVRGQRIDAYCAGRQPDVRTIVELLVRIADAVAAAHRMLVVHSDIKPGNILVNEDGAPKLVDFGIATALREADAGEPAAGTLQRLYSPNYAAPEQLEGGAVTVTTDVYGLGGLAYRLLTGVAPYAEAMDALSYRRALGAGPVRMPSAAARIAGKPARLVRTLEGDLDAILSRALERDPARRYQSAVEFRDDLQRYLDRYPVHARPVTILRRGMRFLQRNAVAASLGALLTVCLFAGGTAYLLQARHTQTVNAMLLRRGEFLETLIKSANPDEGGTSDITVAQLLDTWNARIDQLAAAEPLVAASLLELVAETDNILSRYDKGLDASARELALLHARSGSAVAIARAEVVRGTLLNSAGRHDEAVTLIRHAVSVVDGAPGEEKVLGEGLGALAAAQRALGNEAEAAQLAQRELALFRRVGGDLESLEVEPLAALGDLAYLQGRYAESAGYIREELAVARKYNPADSNRVQNAQHNLGIILNQEHQYAAAEALFRELIVTRTRVLGADNRATLFERQALASNLNFQGRYADAVVEARLSLDGLMRLLGDNNESVHQALAVYGTAACGTGDGAAGLEALQRAAALRARRLGTDHYTVQQTLVAEATCLIRLRRYGEAEPILLSSVASLEKSRGPANNRTQQAYKALSEVYTALGRPDEAARWQAKLTKEGA